MFENRKGTGMFKKVFVILLFTFALASSSQTMGQVSKLQETATRLQEKLDEISILVGSGSKIRLHDEPIDLDSSFMNEEEEKFNNWIEGQERSLERHFNKMNEEWDSLFISDRKNWAKYSVEGETRSLVRFEKGDIILETQIGEDENPSDRQVIDRLTNHLLQLGIDLKYAQLLIKKRTDSIKVSAQKSNRNALSVSVDTELIKKILTTQFLKKTTRNLQSKANKIVKVLIQEYRTRKGMHRKKLKVVIPMRKDHLSQREKLFSPIIKKYSQQFGLDISLVMAVTKAESSFNPNAISRDVNLNPVAYGLMQLVPKSGAREAYYSLFGSPRTVPGSMLFNPDYNVMLGTAYLTRLKRHYFKPVKNLEKRQYLMIAAYNTGPNNVARAFIKGRKNARKLSRALKQIRGHTAAAVYGILINKLPYRETRRYLPRVVTYMLDYQT
jgi:membrane-bound lytic murein transglycosylase C